MHKTVRLCGLGLLTMSAWAASADTDLTTTAQVSIVLIGDSYLIGHGVAAGQKFKDRLQSMLNAKGLTIAIIETGFNGTSASTDARLGSFFTVPKYFPLAANPVVILEVGSNDCKVMGIDKTRANLSHILATFSDKRIPVLIVGTSAYDDCEGAANPNYKAEYVRVFSDLADQYGDLYYRDFKDSVSDHPELLQYDGDHPNAQGEAIIVAKMLPVVQELIARATPPQAHNIDRGSLLLSAVLNQTLISSHLTP